MAKVEVVAPACRPPLYGALPAVLDALAPLPEGPWQTEAADAWRLACACGETHLSGFVLLDTDGPVFRSRHHPRPGDAAPALFLTRRASSWEFATIDEGLERLETRGLLPTGFLADAPRFFVRTLPCERCFGTGASGWCVCDEGFLTQLHRRPGGRRFVAWWAALGPAKILEFEELARQARREVAPWGYPFVESVAWSFGDRELTAHARVLCAATLDPPEVYADGRIGRVESSGFRETLPAVARLYPHVSLHFAPSFTELTLSAVHLPVSGTLLGPPSV